MSDVTRQHARAQRRSTRPLIRAFRLTLAVVGLSLGPGAATMGFASNAAQPLPVAESLLKAGQNDADWLLPAKTYSGNRHTALTQIQKTDVATLRMAWRTDLADDGQQEASPIVWDAAKDLSTPHEGVIALDASDGKLLWRTPYNPKYVLLYAVNRGVGLADGKVFIATQDCRVIALSAATGKALWNVQGCRDTSNSFYSSGDGQQPFPAMHLPALQQVTLGAATCAPGREEHARASTIAGSQ